MVIGDSSNRKLIHEWITSGLSSLLLFSWKRHIWGTFAHLEYPLGSVGVWWTPRVVALSWVWARSAETWALVTGLALLGCGTWEGCLTKDSRAGLERTREGVCPGLQRLSTQRSKCSSAVIRDTHRAVNNQGTMSWAGPVAYVLRPWRCGWCSRKGWCHSSLQVHTLSCGPWGSTCSGTNNISVLILVLF